MGDLNLFFSFLQQLKRPKYTYSTQYCNSCEPTAIATFTITKVFRVRQVSLSCSRSKWGYYLAFDIQRENKSHADTRGCNFDKCSRVIWIGTWGPKAPSLQTLSTFGIGPVTFVWSNHSDISMSFEIEFFLAWGNKWDLSKMRVLSLPMLEKCVSSV